MNHFSQRYPKIPAFAEKYEQCANIAFDLMTVDFTDFQMLSTLLPALKVLFKEDIEEREEKQRKTESKKGKNNKEVENTNKNKGLQLNQNNAGKKRKDTNP